MDYLYVRVMGAKFDTNSPERKAFREHLMLVANALRSIEWNDSGDGDDREAPNIMACISLSALENNMLRAEVARQAWHIEKLRSKIDAEKSCACSFDAPGDVCAAHSPSLMEARAEVERTHALLKDPNAVAINMLRGVIALPSADQIRHIYQQTLEAKP